MARLTHLSAAIGVITLSINASTVSAQPEPDLPELHQPPVLEVPSEIQTSSAYALLPEGTFLSNRLFRVVPIGQHARAAVFVRSGVDTPIRPMALMPCANTLAIEQLADTGDSSILFEASGQVFISNGLNYFLPLYVRVASADEAQPVATPLDPGPQPESNPPLLDKSSDDIAVEDLIRELDAATAADAAIREQANRPISLQREGGVVTLRRGRVIRNGTGVSVFHYDSGFNAETPDADSPMGLMPCSLTDEMERIASRRGDHVTFTVSGRVFLYNEANYLLPTMFFTNRAGEGGLSSAQ